MSEVSSHATGNLEAAQQEAPSGIMYFYEAADGTKIEIWPSGAIKIESGGSVHVRPAKEWHKLAVDSFRMQSAVAASEEYPPVTDAQMAAIRAKFPQDHELAETVLDVLNAPSSTVAAICTDDLFPLLWRINDCLRITPDQGVEFEGSTNDVDAFRDALHRLDPEFKRGVCKKSNL